MGKKNMMRSIVKVFQKLKKWQKKTHIGTHNHVSSIVALSDVPPGHVAVSVGDNHRRYVMCAKHLNHPIFEKLLKGTEDKYGFSKVGPLVISCEESLFEKIIDVLNRFESSRQGKKVTLEDIQRCNHAEMMRSVENYGESRPLLQGYGGKRIVLKLR